MGVLLVRSSEIGGKKLVGTRFIERLTSSGYITFVVNGYCSMTTLAVVCGYEILHTPVPWAWFARTLSLFIGRGRTVPTNATQADRAGPPITSWRLELLP